MPYPKKMHYALSKKLLDEGKVVCNHPDVHVVTLDFTKVNCGKCLQWASRENKKLRDAMDMGEMYACI